MCDIARQTVHNRDIIPANIILMLIYYRQQKIIELLLKAIYRYCTMWNSDGRMISAVQEGQVGPGSLVLSRRDRTVC